MKLLLYVAAITHPAAASFLRNAAPRSAGGLLFLNTTQAALSTSTMSVSPVISSAAGSSLTTQRTTTWPPTTPPVRPGSSSTAVTAPTSPGDSTIVDSSFRSKSTPGAEPTISDPSTVILSSLGGTSSPGRVPASSSDSSLGYGSSNPGSNPAGEPASSADKPGSSSTHTLDPTTSGRPTAVRGSPDPGSDPVVAPTNAGDLTTTQASTSWSTYTVKPTTFAILTTTQPESGLSSNPVAGPASTDATTASYPSSVQPGSGDKAGPASTATHKPGLGWSTTGAEAVKPTEPPADRQSPSVHSTSPTALRQATSGVPSRTRTLTLASALSRTAHSTATADVTSRSRQDGASGSVSTSRTPWAATTALPPASASKPQTAMHAAASGANTTVDGSLLIATSPTTPPAGVHVNVAENLASNGGTVTSQTKQGSDSTRRTSTASAVTLSSGGAVPTTILTEAASPTRVRPSSAATPLQGLPRVILPNSARSSTDGNLIQLGFLFPLNYVFVSQHLQAAAQIFEVLPVALAHGTVQRGAIQVAKLVPYDTQATVGYIATVAKLHYPKASVDELQREILDPRSEIYTGGGDMQRNLTALIDPSIKITDDDGGMDCASPPCDASPGTSGSSKQTGITVGAVVGGAAACGVMGLGIFQLYRRRGSALATAWPFRKQKTRLTVTRISRPVGSVNSLGWDWLTEK
ncbi:hypothetical protein V2A60_002423 [Cordyceps javanica]